MTDQRDSLRSRLVAIALEWEQTFGVAPHITSAVSEYDAALLVGHTPESYATDCVSSARTAVTAGADFAHRGLRYQVKTNRPSGKPGSKVTLVGQAKNYDWDKLLWLLYDRTYTLLEAWEWDVVAYREAFANRTRLGPEDMRRGRRLRP